MNRYRQRSSSLACACAALCLMLGSCTAPKETAPQKPAETAPAAPGTTARTVQRDSVRVLSINALHALHDEASVRRFAAWVKTFEPDVVAVQQIERPMEGKKDFDAVRELARALDMSPFFGVARYYKGFDSGNALFSMYPIRQSGVEPLPVSKGKVRRSLAYAVIDVGLQSVGFASTELDDQSDAERKAQARALVGLVPQFSDFPFVVCGEFYERAAGATAPIMKEKFASEAGQPGASGDATQHVYAAARTVAPASARKAANKDIHSDALIVMLRVVSQ